MSGSDESSSSSSSSSGNFASKLSNLSLQLYSHLLQNGYVKNEEELLFVEKYFNSKMPKYKYQNLGFRESEILNGKGAKITKARDYPDCFRVRKGSNSFIFTYKKRGYKDYTIVG